MKVTINIPDEVYSELVIIAERNTRTITQEVLHRVKSFGSSVDAGIVHTEKVAGHVSAKGEVVIPEVKPKVVKDKVVEYNSGKKVSPKVGKGSGQPKADTGKKGLPMQDVGGLKTYFKK